MSSNSEKKDKNNLEENASENESEVSQLINTEVGTEARTEVDPGTPRIVQDNQGNNQGNNQGITAQGNTLIIPSPSGTPGVGKGLVKARKQSTEQELSTLDRVTV